MKCVSWTTRVESARPDQVAGLHRPHSCALMVLQSVTKERHA